MIKEQNVLATTDNPQRTPIHTKAMHYIASIRACHDHTSAFCCHLY